MRNDEPPVRFPEVKDDPAMPPCEIHFRDGESRLVGTIYNLKVPWRYRLGGWLRDLAKWLEQQR